MSDASHSSLQPGVFARFIIPSPYTADISHEAFQKMRLTSPFYRYTVRHAASPTFIMIYLAEQVKLSLQHVFFLEHKVIFVLNTLSIYGFFEQSDKLWLFLTGER